MAESGGPRILLCNDDGINAAGLGVLEGIARSLSDDVWICAPEIEQSGAGHSLTIHRPLRLRQIEDKRFSVDGTPTDCVLLAVNHIMHDRKPDLVLSGINHGFNIGEDVTYSGTIAAAMEATLLGIPAVALSQEVGDKPAKFAAAEHWGPVVMRKLLSIDWPTGILLNVNFPQRPAEAVTGIAVLRHGNRKIGDELMKRVDPRGRAYFWIGTARNGAVDSDSDVHALQSGQIAITPLHVDLTHYPTIESLRQAFT